MVWRLTNAVLGIEEKALCMRFSSLTCKLIAKEDLGDKLNPEGIRLLQRK